MNIHEAINKGVFDISDIKACSELSAEENYFEIELQKLQLILDKAEKQNFDLSDFKGHQANGDSMYYFRNKDKKTEFWVDFGCLPELNNIDTNKLTVKFGYMDYINKVSKFSKRYTIKYCIEHTIKKINS